MSGCIYCGYPLDGGRKYTCHAHSDLPDLDPGAKAVEYRRWWLRRYTLEEIKTMAADFEPKSTQERHRSVRRGHVR